MTKKIVLVLLIFTISLSLLTACEGIVTRLLTRNSTTPTRGVWDEHVYTNEYLGFHFVLQSNWLASTDEEIAEIMGLGSYILQAADNELPDNFWDNHNITIIHDMMSLNILTGASVQVSYERLFFPNTRISESAFIRASANHLEQVGARVNFDFPGTTRIGNYYWYSYGVEMNFFGATTNMRYFVNVHEGFARSIAITYSYGSETVEDMLAMFIDLDEPIPDPPLVLPLEHAPELIGTWVWGEDEMYTYSFFTNGRGIRGFYWWMEEFDWKTIGDDFLILSLGVQFERWTFTIDGDALTIESRQIPGLMHNYIRQ